MEPKIILGEKEDPKYPTVNLNLDPSYLKAIREGMRDGVMKEYGVAKGLNNPTYGYTVAAKTGTAELGVYKQFVNSWVSGFFPYENPKYAFVVIMEKGPGANTVGGLSIMRQVLDYMAVNKPEYFK